jgi:hypothetical protein
LAKLHTYLLALAITGSVRESNSAQEETFGSDSTNYVTAPWDVLLAYYFRAVESARAIPEASRLAWLVKTDTAEREVWASTFRDGEATIGEVVKHIMEGRGSRWDPPANLDASRTGITKSQDKRKKQEEQPARQFQSPMKTPPSQPKSTPGSVSATLKDGRRLFPKFQRGNCHKGASCHSGLHKCGKVKAKGKICGMNYHGANVCGARW